MADNINDKEKENINNDEKINFTWKEIDEPFRKKSRGSLFNFIKRKTAEFAKVFESKKPDESVQVAKPNKPAESVEVAEPTGPDKPTEPVMTEESEEMAKDIETTQETEVIETVEPETSDEKVQVAEAIETVETDVSEEEAQVVEPVETAEAVESEEIDQDGEPAEHEEAKADETEESEEVKADESTVEDKPARKAIRLTKWRVLFGVLCLIAVALLGTFIYAYNTVPDIDPDASNIYSNIDLSSIIYDSKGEEIDKLYYTEDREIVSIKDIPENTKNAFIAIEDKTFYKHHGLNYKRLFGAVLSKLTGRSDEISGTSTITQQLARNVFLSDIKSERTLRRKFREMIYALKIERAYSKDEILEAYLNTIYLGYGCYGIKAAAYTYFGKEVSELSLEESAALAALPQAPDSYALLKDEKGEDTTYMKKYKLYANNLATERRDLVLDLMAEQGYIDSAQAEKAKKKMKEILHPHIEKKPRELTYFTERKRQSCSYTQADSAFIQRSIRIYSMRSIPNSATTGTSHTLLKILKPQW